MLLTIKCIDRYVIFGKKKSNAIFSKVIKKINYNILQKPMARIQ